MNRINLQKLAEERILDGQTLLGAGRWSGAYYVTGYAVECGLKACVLRRVENTGVIFLDPKFSQRCFTHSFIDLLKLGDLEPAHGLVVQSNALFKTNWELAVEWSEESRYRTSNQSDAEALMQAVITADGVMPWIRSLW